MTDWDVRTPDAAPYFEGLSRGEVRVQRCLTCCVAQFPFRVHCSHCGGRSVQWETVDGAGTLYAKTINRRAPEKEFEPLVPYAVGLVDLDVGVRVLARAAFPFEQVVTGMRVRLLADPDPIVMPGLVFVPLEPTRPAAP
jgi:uncharacterized protein